MPACLFGAACLVAPVGAAIEEEDVVRGVTVFSVTALDGDLGAGCIFLGLTAIIYALILP